MTSTAPTLENLSLTISQEIQVNAPIETTFAALLDQIGPANETPEGKPLPMVIEPRPGGRWFRDLGKDDGHFWGHVQAIKRPTLLEITGPLFMSFPVVSNVQYRLTEISGGTRIEFRHQAFGVVPEEYRQGMGRGWTAILDRVQKHAEAARITH
jgi:uncharacterized protein YndB with AHSA1/START domain